MVSTTAIAQNIEDTVIEDIPSNAAAPASALDIAAPLPAQVPSSGGSYYEPMQYETEELQHPDEIVTEESYAADYVYYLAPPETTDVQSLYPNGTPQFNSAVELALDLARVEKALALCPTLRQGIENEIGDLPGSYSVDIGWTTYYQNCVIQYGKDLKTLSPAITIARQNAIAGLGDEGATMEFEFLDKLAIKFSELKRRHTQEAQMKTKLFNYYRTGIKDY
ncbi:MAG: hypothetical protein ACWA5L_00675 [bacterium]